MNNYRQEQLESQYMVIRYFETVSGAQRGQLERLCENYRGFREKVHRFQERHLQTICTQACFQDQKSACCNKDGIITFFADLVVNALFAPPQGLADLAAALQTGRDDMKCVYLGPEGCRWHIKPIVCEMFLCDQALEGMKAADPQAEATWQTLLAEAKRFRWPDRPVLFDVIESRFLAAGLCSPLMYLHNSPGLVRIKRKAGLA
jgi:hypothetical protein